MARRSLRRRAGTAGVLALGLGAGLLLSVEPGSPGGPLGPPVATAAELPAFTSCAELRSYLLAQEPEARLALPGAAGAGMESDTAAMAAGPARASGTGPAVGAGATGTNVQEQGVDEPDLAKTDGRRLITVRERALSVVDVAGPAARRVGAVRLPAGVTASELLLLGGGTKALVLGTWTGRRGIGEPDPAAGSSLRAPEPDDRWWQATSTLTLVDLADPAAPRVLESTALDGRYVSARQHGDAVRVVVSATPRGLLLPEGDRARTGDGDWLPHRYAVDGRGELRDAGPLLDCSDVRRPSRPSGVDAVTVLTVDTRRGLAVSDRTAVLTGGDLVYASADRLFVATTTGGWGCCWTMTGRSPRPPEPDPLATAVHAFDITRPDRTPYVASGRVGGYVLGRWAFDQHEGRLRVATTSAPPWGDPGDGRTGRTESSVTVLEERGDRLQAVGSVGGLGKGETIRAVRWFDDLAAVVTFRQTDPLYLVDLSAPASPRLAGELKVPGYSAYLHPLGDDLLLGVGQDADLDGTTRGLQVSTFDVSDPARPQRVDVLTRAGTASEVESDSRAFTYLPQRRLAVLPVQDWEAGSATTLGVEVGPDGELREVGTVRHDGTELVRRVVPVGERLAAVGTAEVQVLEPATLDVLATVPLDR